MNVCPVCRNVNSRDATICRYCQTALTPPQDPALATAARPRRWPWVAGAVALVLVAAIGGFSFLGGGGPPPVAAAFPLEVGTGEGASLEFVPTSVSAPPNTPVDLTFNNLSTLPHNLTFQAGGPITAATDPNVAGAASETIMFRTPEPGTYQFVCTIHPGMDGELVVGPEAQ